jgi:ADP-ribose pyrophosphatase YjhB (NUDIX family)/energy-coupling factor transporter ATP-binding protein EcfA2
MPQVFAHIGGASGSGKSTLLEALQKLRPDIVTKDLDEFDEKATEQLKLPPKWKTDYTDEMIQQLAARRQQLMDRWIARQKKPVILGGHHVEGDSVLDVHTDNKLLLDTPAWLSAWRAYKRSQNEDPQHRRRLTELPQDWMEARRDVSKLRQMNYIPHTKDEIIALLTDKQAASAKGIPDRSEYGDMAQLQAGQLVNWIIQRHMARRAGPHYDVRFGTPDTGLFSWATRKELPPPGKKILAVQQPLHSHAYGQFEGEIPSGYGAGTVKKHDEGKILLTKVEPGKVHFTVAHRRYPERFVLVKPQSDKGVGSRPNNWLLMNVTPTTPLPYKKESYKSIPADKVEPLLEKLQEGSSVQAKIDGALTLTHLLKDKIEVLSYRQSKVHGGPILHTERVFHGLPQTEIPKEYQGSVLKGELYAQQHAPSSSGAMDVPFTGEGLQPRVRVVMPYKDKYLLETLHNKKYPERLGMTRFPGGGVEPGETPRQAAVRELQEELGVKIAPNALTHLGVIPHHEWKHDEHYLHLPEHTVTPGIYRNAIGGDQEIHLTAGHPTGPKYFGPDVSQLLARVHGPTKVAPQVLGGILNSSVAKSLEAQRANDIGLKQMVFDVQQVGKKPIDFNKVPYAERSDTVRKILAAIGGPESERIQSTIQPPQEAKSPADALRLYREIASGQHPATEEGIIIHPKTGKPMKSKLFDEHDVFVRGFFPGQGKWKDKGVGGFVYSHEPEGPIAGEVGTGFTDAMRQEFFNNPDEYVGRRARVQSTAKLRSGALFQPSLLALHEDYPLAPGGR